MSCATRNLQKKKSVESPNVAMPFSRTHDVVSLSLSIEPPIQDFNGATRRVAQAILAQQRGREGYGPSAVTSASEQASKRIETIYT